MIWTRCRGWSPGPTITSASRCARRCCWRASAPCCAAATAPARLAWPALRSVWKFAALQLDNGRREAWLGGQLIELTGAEFDLLWLLASHAGRILSREEIFAALRGIQYDGQDRSIDVRISRIRPKIGDDPDLPRLIKTIRGKGYLFVGAAGEA